MRIMNIMDLCYKLYKEDWESRISPERKKSLMIDFWYNISPEDRTEEALAEYLDENGYQGELYVCFEEFLGAEFLDKEYMKELLTTRELFHRYLNYTKETVDVTVYCDSTDLFTEEECEKENLCELTFPRYIVESYARRYMPESMDLDNWLEEYTADEAEDLYWYAVRLGYKAKRYKEVA